MKDIGFPELQAWLEARTKVRAVGPVRGVRLRGIALDSRRVAPGDLFIAVRGECIDSHDLIAEARARGAAAVLGERPGPAGMPALLVDATRPLVGSVAALFLGDPAAQLRVIGITGTNGKTTTAWGLWHVLSAADGAVAGLLGTIENILGAAGRTTAGNTTPGPLELHQSFAAMVRAGARSCVVEVSSHGIVQDRVAGVPFAAGVLTNIGSDHLDYHGSIEAYRDAKTRFFAALDARSVAVLNAEDPACEYVASRTRARVARYRPAGWDGLTHCAVNWAGAVRLECADAAGSIAVQTRSWGRHNAENLCAVVCCARALAIPWDAIGAGLDGFAPPAGRLEQIPAPGFTVLVDYAHTACALQRVLAGVREGLNGSGRLILVFGCGGDRDRTKRPHMGRAACEGADVAILTSDNPRTEDPEAIVADVLAGVPAGATHLRVVAERAEAIREAIAEARAGDAVLIAGKGHEDYQIVGTERRPFDDRAAARRAIEELQHGVL